MTRSRITTSRVTSWHLPRIAATVSRHNGVNRELSGRLTAMATEGGLLTRQGKRVNGLSDTPKLEVDHARIENAVREILAAVGEDPNRHGLEETPARVARMYAEMFSGLKSDPGIHLQKFFTEKYDEVVLVRDISFCSMCEHHLLPFMGKAHIGYLPNGKVVGLSKLARVVEVVSKRPQVQERMTQTIATLLETELGARGVAVVIEATHSCMTIRGVRKPGSMCVTSTMKGIFRENLSSRSEIMQLIYGDRR